MNREMDLNKIICFDTETTGLDRESEILQLAIINGFGDVLFNELIKPKCQTTWSHAEKVHHISPTMVEKCKTIDSYFPILKKIFKEAEIYVGYNLPYDIRMLKQSGFPADCLCRKGCQQIDIMKVFAPVFGEKNAKSNRYKWQSLATCADYYHYDWGKDKAHGALADAKATLFCFKKLYMK
ncbi:MAG: 3'-5' exonuclease [Selenomonadaceae bacterium]|nr:3'-5' exonuclease [Selenomonadaceae bacterium]